MDTINLVEKRFFDIARLYDISFNNKSIKDIDVGNLSGQIMKLKFNKEIKNTEYELLMKKKILFQIFKYIMIMSVKII